MSRVSIFSNALLACVGMSLSLHVRATPPPVSPAPSESTQQTTPHSRQVPKSGDRNCLRDTGSLIPARKGECLPVNGRSYSGDELRRTGTNDNARALQMLDPSISVGH